MAEDESGTLSGPKDFRMAALYEQMGNHEAAQDRVHDALKKNPEWSLAQIRVSEPYRDQTTFENFIELLRRAGMPD